GDAAHAAQVPHVRAELLVDLPVAALAEEVFVEGAERGHEGVRVAQREDVAVGVVHAQKIREELCAPSEQKLEEAGVVRPRHLARPLALWDDLDARGFGSQSAYDDAARG